MEINSACAVSTGCFPGDSPGYPVTIFSRGSYRLTSSLVQTEIPTISTAVPAIEISSDQIHLDLNGFAIACENPFGSCSGSADGITRSGGFYKSIVISKGVVSGFPDDCIDLSSTQTHVERVQAIACGDRGIDVGARSRVERCTTSSNGNRGIAADGLSHVRDNTTLDNGDDGITAADGAVVEGNISRGNAGGNFCNGSPICP